MCRTHSTTNNCIKQKKRACTGLEPMTSRPLHRYRKGHGLKSRKGLNSYSGLIFTTAQVVFITAKIAFVSK